VVGPQPYTYAWHYIAGPIAGQTGPTRTLADLQGSQAGLYWVVVSNAFGSTTSAVAQLVLQDACVDIQMYAGVNIAGQAGSRYVLKASTDLNNTDFSTWTPLATNVMGNSNWFYLDVDSPFSPKRFYRVKLLP
jgi:hypothetical protein